MTHGRRGFAWSVFGAAAFTIYGSLVPFQFGSLSLSAAVEQFAGVLAGGVRVESRSDAIANVLLGVPLGFALLGFAAVDRFWRRGKSARFGLYLLPLCVGFASAVEFAQLFTTSRNCSASDILAQGLGSAAGMTAWVVFGQALTNRVRAIWNRADTNAPERLLFAYLCLLAFIQLLPFDLSLSPYQLYHKLRGDGQEGSVHLIPFGDFNHEGIAERWSAVGKLVKLAGLYVPVGLLAALLGGPIRHWSVLRVAVAALELAVGMETLQLPVRSRVSSTTDALVGAAAVVAAWYAGRVHQRGLALPFVASWGLVWFAGMTVVTQSPPGTQPRETPRAFDWIPGLPLESGEPLNALEEMLTKVVLFGLLGVLIAAWRLPTRHGMTGAAIRAAIIAAVLGLLISGFFESRQRWYDTHTPCISDVLLGALGAALGVLAASRARGRSAGSTPRAGP